MVKRAGMGCVLIAAMMLGGCAGLPQGERAPDVETIVRWSQDGKPVAEILQQLQAGGAVYRLPASELARLHARGVAEAVIDAMQQSWLEDARRNGYRDGFLERPMPLFRPGGCWSGRCW